MLRMRLITGRAISVLHALELILKPFHRQLCPAHERIEPGIRNVRLSGDRNLLVWLPRRSIMFDFVW